MSAAAGTEYFKPLTPNNNFLQQSGETVEYLAHAQKAQAWRNNLPPIVEKPGKAKKIKKQSNQINLF